jgi:hypothetical protein
LILGRACEKVRLACEEVKDDVEKLPRKKRRVCVSFHVKREREREREDENVDTWSMPPSS